MGGASGDEGLAERIREGDLVAVARACEQGGDALPSGAARAKAVAECRKILAIQWKRDEVTPNQVDAAAVAALVLATSAELERLRWPVLPSDVELGRELVARREPAFRDAWVERAMAAGWAGPGVVAVDLIRSGRAPKPQTDSYTLALIANPGWFALPGRQEWRGAPVIDVLRSNPALLEVDLWRVFEVEGGGEDSLAARDKYTREDLSWKHALVTLCDEGAVDRNRLLDASLDALQRGFAPFRAQWFSSFHEALSPTPSERSARAGAYLDLVASPVSSTTSMALKALVVVQQAGGLDPAAVLDHLGPAMVVSAKAQAKLAIKLVVGALRGHPDLAGEGALVLADGLANPNAEIQELALATLRGACDVPPEPVRAATERSRDGCHPAVRTAIDAWLGTAPELRLPAPSPAPRTVRTVTLADLAALSDDQRLEVPTDLDELFERASALVEEPATADEIEAVLAAAARLGRAPVAADPRAGTLARRAVTMLDRDGAARQLVALAVIAWLAPELLPDGFGAVLPPGGGGKAHRSTLGRAFASRALELARSLRDGEAFDPLAAPTHRGGSIDPMVFVERVIASPPEPERAELLVALLRLAPDAVRLRDAAELLGSADTLGIGAWMREWAAGCEADLAHQTTWAMEDHWLRARPLDDLLVAPASVVLQMEPDRAWDSPVGRFADPSGVRWLASLVPGRPAWWARVGVRSLGPTSGSREVSHGDPAFLERFFDPDVPMGDACHLLIALALSDQRPAVYAMAVDLAAAAVDDGRLDADELGVQIGQLASTAVVTPKRWGRSLADLAAVGEPHHLVVVGLLQKALAVAEPSKPQDLLALLELLETLLLELGGGAIGPDTAVALEPLAGGGGKTSAVARRLLAVRAP